jgi:Mn-dependent DtxR family transcriptional regulator
MADAQWISNKTRRFLLTLYCLSNGEVGKEISAELIFDIVHVDFDNKGPVLRTLAHEGLVEWSNSANPKLSNKGKIEARKIMDSTYAERERAVLNAVYEIADRQIGKLVVISELAKALNMSSQEVTPILNDLEDRKGFLDGINEAVSITPRGVEFLEMASNSESSQQKHRDREYAVLKYLFDYGGSVRGSMIAESLSLPSDLVDTILLDFQKRKWVSLAFGYTAEITPAGKSAFYKWNDRSESVSQSAITYNVNNYGTAQIGGQGNTINIQQTSANFNEAIRSVIELLQSSSLNPDDKDEALTDIKAVSKLAAQNPPNAFERAKLKITAVETIVKGTDLVVKMAPYWQAIRSYFESL